MFNQHKRLIVSAPTSFGKSRIIEEIIIHNDYINIAIILPTIALLSETYIRFNSNSIIKESYNLVNSLGLADTINKHNKNIFILTPEKMDMLLDEILDLKIDFFVMDEIYKIQDDEDRKSVFSNCLYRLSKMKTDFYLI
ncbi:DEAD/DEAH box helicase [Chryseobacterium wanjuense]